MKEQCPVPKETLAQARIEIPPGSPYDRNRAQLVNKDMIQASLGHMIDEPTTSPVWFGPTPVWSAGIHPGSQPHGTFLGFQMAIFNLNTFGHVQMAAIQANEIFDWSQWPARRATFAAQLVSSCQTAIDLKKAMLTDLTSQPPKTVTKRYKERVQAAEQSVQQAEHNLATMLDVMGMSPDKDESDD